MMIRDVRTAEVGGGVRLQYVEHGDAGGTPVVLLHGLTDSWRSFECVLPHLPRSLRAIAVSQRGHGDSDRPEGGYRPSDFARDVAALLDALTIPKAVVVGHSMGSAVAQRFAVDYPDRTLGLVLVGAILTCRGNVAAAELAEAVATLADPVDPAFVREFQESTVARPVPPALIDVAVAESLKVPARVWRAAIEGVMREDATRELAKIAAPTLIVWGDRDAYFLRRDQETLASEIRGSQFVVYEGTGHAVHWEEPLRFAADLSAFASS